MTDISWDQLAGLVDWLDRSSPDGPERPLLRVMKITEEAGEAAEAVIGLLGHNPRKGRIHTRQDVVDELCDVAVTALIALASFSDDPRRDYQAHVAKVADRAGVTVRRRPPRFPVSIKGVVVRDDRVLLLRNERDEWELPGGRLELGEDPIDCLAREIGEETGWEAEVGPILDSWQYHVFPGADVLIVTYGVTVATGGAPVLSHEHREIGLFTEAEVGGLRMPENYKRSIATWFAVKDERPPGAPAAFVNSDDQTS
ncbi:NUDIX domain-containing protein [Herbidospora daliensis]|uniref:NUDIX domain-containing protein n=1 Tax=Herbidospora daliensis TaxID=295585 RepID=UPI001E3945AF|nr:NUDIX domain-containing protein [Herbidospora daliensis]